MKTDAYVSTCPECRSSAVLFICRKKIYSWVNPSRLSSQILQKVCWKRTNRGFYLQGNSGFFKVGLFFWKVVTVSWRTVLQLSHYLPTVDWQMAIYGSFSDLTTPRLHEINPTSILSWKVLTSVDFHLTVGSLSNQLRIKRKSTNLRLSINMKDVKLGTEGIQEAVIIFIFWLLFARFKQIHSDWVDSR